jgi:HD-GYP domain-containing protein (c-di-GMP phosphodiesterase class II)
MSSDSGKTVDVLIGSPRDSFWETVTVILKGYYPYKLQHHRSADLSQVTEDPSFAPILAIIDGQDGTQSAIEWAQSIKMNYPDCPLIVLHSAAAPLDFDLVKRNGATEVMHICFDREFISDMVLQLAPIDLDGDHIPITALMPVDLRDIEANMTLTFDAYVHLPSNHRSILLRKAGDHIEDHHVAKFKNMHQSMYVKKTQTDEFFQYARQILEKRQDPFPISMTEKFQRSKKMIYNIMTQFLNGSVTDYSEGKEIFEKCQLIIADFELAKDLTATEIFEELCRFTGNSRSNYHDCICMSAYAAYFAQLLGWDKAKRESMAIAGLLHNIGLSQLPVSVGEKAVADYTEEELVQYKLYPERSINLVKAKKVPLSPEISDAMAQHRENIFSTGFPKKLPVDDLSVGGKLMQIAYRFHEMTALTDAGSAFTAAQALMELKERSVDGISGLDLIMMTTITKKLKF